MAQRLSGHSRVELSTRSMSSIRSCTGASPLHQRLWMHVSGRLLLRRLGACRLCRRKMRYQSGSGGSPGSGNAGDVHRGVAAERAAIAVHAGVPFLEVGDGVLGVLRVRPATSSTRRSRPVSARKSMRLPLHSGRTSRPSTVQRIAEALAQPGLRTLICGHAFVRSRAGLRAAGGSRRRPRASGG